MGLAFIVLTIISRHLSVFRGYTSSLEIVLLLVVDLQLVALVIPMGGVKQRLAQIHDLGMKVPEDFAVVGFDDNEFAGLTRPTLTSVQQPGEIVGQKSVELLLRQINDPARPIEPLVFPCKLIVRESTIGRRQAPAGKTEHIISK